MASYCIYKHTNKINNKIYIGQTCQKPEYRWNNGEGYKGCPRFYNAIQKYGWENFSHEILVNDLTLEEANYQEEYWISFFDSANPSYGYNLSLGGANKTIQDETRKKLSDKASMRWKDENYKQHISQIMTQKWQDPEYREKQKEIRKNIKHTMSEEGKKRISQIRKEYVAKYGTPTQGKGHSQETKEKIRQSKLGEKNPQFGKTTSEKQKQRAKEANSKKVMCVETQEIFNSQKEAAEWCGLKSGGSISGYLSGKKKSAGKHPVTKEPLHWEVIN